MYRNIDDMIAINVKAMHLIIQSKCKITDISPDESAVKRRPFRFGRLQKIRKVPDRKVVSDKIIVIQLER